MIETTRLWCHDCRGYFTVDMDMEQNGQHEIVCPSCGHIHYRIVENGVVTEERYRSSMGMRTITTTTYDWSTTAASTDAYTIDLWAASTTASATSSGW